MVEPVANRIVVGVDLSPCSLEALRWAVREALARGFELDVVLAWQDPGAITGPPSLIGLGREGLSRLRADLAEHVERVAKEEGAEAVHVREAVVPGHAVHVLVDQSRGATALVVGRTGLAGFSRWMFGSVSQRCAQLSDVPVVIIPFHGEHEHEHEDPQAEHEHQHSHFHMHIPAPRSNTTG